MSTTPAMAADPAAESVVMPDGKLFEMWDDSTSYSTVYHVNGPAKNASDSNPGTADKPFATIGRAA